MVETFSRSGISFRYPNNWAFEIEEANEGWTVTLTSPETAFLLVSFRPDVEVLDELADEALSALKAEYPDLEHQRTEHEFAGHFAIGEELDFITLDTPVLGYSRCVDTAAGALLILWQTSEYDRARLEPVLNAVCASFQIEGRG